MLLRKQLAVEAARSAELAAARNRLQIHVATLSEQLDTAAKAEAQERGRLSMESAHCRLLARARGRQVQQLQAQVQQLSSQQENMQREASREAEQLKASVASANREASAALAKAAASGAEVHQLQQDMSALEQAVTTAEARWASV